MLFLLWENPIIFLVFTKHNVSAKMHNYMIILKKALIKLHLSRSNLHA